MAMADRITEVADAFGRTPRTIRDWRSAGHILINDDQQAAVQLSPWAIANIGKTIKSLNSDLERYQQWCSEMSEDDRLRNNYESYASTLRFFGHEYPSVTEFMTQPDWERPSILRKMRAEYDARMLPNDR